MKNVLFTGLTCCIIVLLFNCRQPSKLTLQLHQKDSVRLTNYIDSVYDLQFQFPDSAFYLWQKAAAEAKAKRIYKPLFSYYKYAVYNRLLLVNDTATAYRLATEATHLSEQTGDSLHIGIAAFCMGMLYANKEITDSASYYFMITAEHLEGGKDWGTLLDAYSNLAAMMRIQGDFRNAEKYLNYIQTQTRNRKEWRELADSYCNLYEVQNELGNTILAKTYIDSAAKYYAIINVPEHPNLLRIKGAYELDHGSISEAIQYYTNASNGYLQLGDSMNASIALLSKAKAFAEQQKTDSVIVELDEVNAVTNPEYLPRTSLKNYYELQLTLPKNVMPAQLRDSLSKKYITLVNSLLEANKKLIGTEYLHHMEQATKNKQILESALQNTRKQKTIALLLIGACCLVMILIITWLYWRKKQQLEQEKTALLRHEKNLEVLQTRMNTQLEERSRISQELHDELGATLTSISLAAELLKKKHLLEDSREANIISHLSSDMVDKMNEIVWSLNTGNDNLQSLVAYIRNFAGSFLEESNIGLRFIETNPLPEMPMQGFIRRSLYLTVKEALNNIVKHAGATEVILQVEFKEQALQIMIQDNGIGIAKKEENRWGNGIKNMKAHLKAIGGMIDWNTHGGTQINIFSPLS